MIKKNITALLVIIGLVVSGCGGTTHRTSYDESTPNADLPEIEAAIAKMSLDEVKSFISNPDNINKSGILTSLTQRLYKITYFDQFY